MRVLIILLSLIFSLSFSQNRELSIIPQPKKLIKNEGFFILNPSTLVSAEANTFEIDYLIKSIQNQTGQILNVKKKSKSTQIIFNKNKTLAENAYQIDINKNRIIIESSSSKGQFYAIQSLLQLIPFEKKKEIKIPCLTIYDEPTFAWRGVHLDVGRHFFDTAFIKKYIDFLATYKMNTFHWHLTEDQGWRIEIKKYPLLTEIGSKRKGTMVGHYVDQTYNDIPYGGFYTQEEIKDIVAYAAQRHITIVPEIEMPGHSLAALAAYPNLACTDGPFEVAKGWGVFEDVFCPKEETFTFLEDVLAEVMTLFPSTYIHIGGDECPKTRWKKCVHCQALIKKEGLNDEYELQSYFIKRIEKFLNKNGRKLIGWDEILEGGLAPNAAVMSWQGESGGIEAAKKGHYVVMTPGSHCYFDHYQGEPKNEPIAIGGFTTLEKVYQYQPIPKELNAAEAKFVMGAQANLWTEYMPTKAQVEYMLFPRLLALSEVVWGTAKPDAFQAFQAKVIEHFKRFDQQKINYSRSIFGVTLSPNIKENQLFIALKSLDPKNIKYTLDGSTPNAKSMSYTEPLLIEKNATLQAAYFENDQILSQVTMQNFYVNLATAKKVSLLNEPHKNYAIGGATALVDGMKGDTKRYGRDWLGFLGKNFETIVDLNDEITIRKIQLGFLENKGSWIHFPVEVNVFSSNDGENFQKILTMSSQEVIKNNGQIMAEWQPFKARFVKVEAKFLDKIPAGLPGAGNKSWVFVDEIQIE
jgi:hexosaminidase